MHAMGTLRSLGVVDFELAYDGVTTSRADEGALAFQIQNMEAYVWEVWPIWQSSKQGFWVHLLTAWCIFRWSHDHPDQVITRSKYVKTLPLVQNISPVCPLNISLYFFFLLFIFQSCHLCLILRASFFPSDTVSEQWSVNMAVLHCGLRHSW